jgi:hypothetical protein
MKPQYLRMAFGALSIAAIATACHGSDFTPTGPLASFSQDIGPGINAMLTEHGFVPDATKLPACTAPVAKVPGKYTSIVAEGNVKGTTFTAVEKSSLYIYVDYTKATPSPPPSPTASPPPTPKPKPEYFYYGTYQLHTGLGGCAYLLTTISGKPIKGSKYNAESLNFPNIKVKLYHVKVVTEGYATMSVHGLSSSGGSGSFVLKTSKGGTYNTGTVDLVGRLTTP